MLRPSGITKQNNKYNERQITILKVMTIVVIGRQIIKYQGKRSHIAWCSLIVLKHNNVKAYSVLVHMN